MSHGSPEEMVVPYSFRSGCTKRGERLLHHTITFRRLRVLRGQRGQGGAICILRPAGHKSTAVKPRLASACFFYFSRVTWRHQQKLLNWTEFRRHRNIGYKDPSKGGVSLWNNHINAYALKLNVIKSTNQWWNTPFTHTFTLRGNLVHSVRENWRKNTPTQRDQAGKRRTWVGLHVFLCQTKGILVSDW